MHAILKRHPEQRGWCVLLLRCVADMLQPPRCRAVSSAGGLAGSVCVLEEGGCTNSGAGSHSHSKALLDQLGTA